MILENGYVSFFSVSGEPAIANGVPVGDAPGTWSELSPCQWRVLQKNYAARSISGQAMTSSSYEILIRDEDAWSERVRLYDSDKRQIGEYPALSSEHLHILGIRRIIV